FRGNGGLVNITAITISNTGFINVEKGPIGFCDLSYENNDGRDGLIFINNTLSPCNNGTIFDADFSKTCKISKGIRAPPNYLLNLSGKNYTLGDGARLNGDGDSCTSGTCQSGENFTIIVNVLNLSNGNISSDGGVIAGASISGNGGIITINASTLIVGVNSKITSSSGNTIRGLADLNFTDTSQSDFNAGTRLSNVSATADGNLTLNKNETNQYPNQTGAFESQIFDAGNTANWTRLKWTEDAPYQEEIGRCVAEDSLITLANGSKKKIKDIEEGEYVQSLDEKTGKLVSNKVNALLDMGNRTVFELTTESGRAVNTTSNHPYLVRIYKNSKSSGTSLTTLPSSSSGECRFSNLEIERFCASKSFARILNNQIPKCLEEANCSSVKCLSRVISNLCSDKVSLKTSPFSMPLGDNLTSCPNLDKKENNPLCTFSSNKNFILSRDKFETSFCELDSKFQGSFDMLFTQRRVSFKDFLMSSSIFEHFQNYRNHDSCSFESGLSMTDIGVNNNVVINFNSHNANNDNPLFKTFENDKLGQWIEVRYLKAGDEIAVPDYESNTIKWQKIISIKQLEAQHVYDLSIEGTRNFIANDIVAHNTYLATSSGNVGIGTTSPQDKLVVMGNTTIQNDLRAYGFVNFTNNTAFNQTLYVVNGNVGIGTTSPIYQLHVVGNVSLNSTLYAVDGKVGVNVTKPTQTLQVAGTLNVTSQETRSADLFVDSAGRVGINTTTPTATLSVEGNFTTLKTNSSIGNMTIGKFNQSCVGLHDNRKIQPELCWI
ncbi:hypothetical protein HYW99_01695, partial [Candidatus Woesearchaeota archaeon]|nr:hypothetical protein [Candidatus Woesearchaeota archaeon]